MTERENRRNLVSWCMKTSFENKVAEKILSGVSMQELDEWLDPIIRNYFLELDAINRLYVPEQFDEGTVYIESDEHICGEKRGIINYCLQIALRDDAIDILDKANTFEEADEKLIDLIAEVKEYGRKINTFYGFEDDEEEHKE